MATRKKESGFVDDLFEVATLLPWWLDVLFAGGSFVGLHHLAGVKEPSTSVDPGRVIGATFVSALATFGQFVVPIVFLAGAVASIVRRARRRKLIESAGRSTGAVSVQAMLWQEFEFLAGEVFRRRGYAVEERGGGGPDGGVDLIARRGGDVTLVQCKHWRSRKVSVGVVRELLGSMTAHGATAGSVVTSGRFTAEAERFADDQGLELIDGDALRHLALNARPVSRGAAITTVDRPDAYATASAPSVELSPSCPICARTMVERTARRGASIGSKFWGCPSYPGCRGTRQLTFATSDADR